MGEGAAFVVLERYDNAVARGADILGEVAGYGMTCDAHHITAPVEDGSGAVAAIEMALADAGLARVRHRARQRPRHVDAHNDAAEAAAIAKVFGPGAVPVTSSKGVTGHLIGAAGAVEAVAALRGRPTGASSPHRQPPPHRPAGRRGGRRARTIERAPAVSTSFAFGGHNVALVLAPSRVMVVTVVAVVTPAPAAHRPGPPGDGRGRGRRRPWLPLDRHRRLVPGRTRPRRRHRRHRPHRRRRRRGRACPSSACWPGGAGRATAGWRRCTAGARWPGRWPGLGPGAHRARGRRALPGRAGARCWAWPTSWS